MSVKIFPKIASQTYDKFKSDPKYLKITKKLIKKLKKIRDPLVRARAAFKEVDLYLKEVFKNPAAEYVSCKKGCSACCHSQIGVTQDEAELMAKIIESGHPIDLNKLAIQAQAKNSAEAWYKIPYDMRSCPFLDEENGCTIYDDRPMVCRTNYVFSDPLSCKTSSGPVNLINLLNTHKADMAIIAAYEVSKSSGALPYKLWEALEKLDGNQIDNIHPHFLVSRELS